MSGTHDQKWSNYHLSSSMRLNHILQTILNETAFSCSSFSFFFSSTIALLHFYGGIRSDKSDKSLALTQRALCLKMTFLCCCINEEEVITRILTQYSTSLVRNITYCTVHSLGMQWYFYFAIIPYCDRTVMVVQTLLKTLAGLIRNI